MSFGDTPRRTPTWRGLILITVLLLAVSAGLVALGLTGSGAARSAGRIVAAPPGGPARQGVTSTTDVTGTLFPQGVGTSVGAAVPGAQGTAQPGAVGTAGAPAAVPSVGAGAVDAPPDQPPAANPPAQAGDSPPWLWIIGGLLLLAILGGAAFMFVRRPATAMPVTPTAAPPPAARSAALVEDAASTTTLPVAALEMPTTPLPAVAPVAGAAAVAAPRPAAAPTMVKCPNCDTMNPIDRRYCDECGQDLRAAVAAAMAGTLPEVEATTPYLETLSRADEQLEFVLARDVITVGRALDNDIVIDDQFIGWQTVSPRHAELRRGAEGFVLRDLDSENGTFVNSARTGENLLQDGMTIAFGKVEFIYRVPTE